MLIVSDVYIFFFPKKSLTDPDCHSISGTSYEILAALEGAFVVDVLPLTSSKQVTISGLVMSAAIELVVVRQRDRSESNGE